MCVGEIEMGLRVSVDECVDGRVYMWERVGLRVSVDERVCVFVCVCGWGESVWIVDECVGVCM